MDIHQPVNEDRPHLVVDVVLVGGQVLWVWKMVLLFVSLLLVDMLSVKADLLGVSEVVEVDLADVSGT